MGLADMHIHSAYSWDGTCSISAILKYAADRTELDVIAITDHNEIVGALEARELAPRYGIELVTGCEISTADGHLLGLFIEELPPVGRSLEETVLWVGERGGICIAAHPMARGVSALSAQVIRDALKKPPVAEVLVGVEAFNAGIFHRESNQVANELAMSLPVAQVGNSDSHVLATIGQGATWFEGTTARDLRKALIEKTSEVRYEKLASGVTVVASWLRGTLLRSAGWIVWNADPQAPIRLAREARVSGSTAH